MDARPGARPGRQPAHAPHHDANRLVVGVRPRAPRPVRRGFLPRQHGAWAMLGVPFAVGVAASGPSWVHLPLLIGWVAAYLASSYALLGLKTRRPGRVRPQVLVWTAVAAPAAAVVLAARPSLWAFVPLLAVLVAIRAWYAARRDERAIVNDLVAATQACLVVPIAAEAGGAPLGTGWLAAGVLFAYFAGTSFYVKTMIREQGSLRWRRRSVLVHAVAALAAWLVAWPVGALFTWFLVRAVVLPHHRLAPRTVGLLEVANSVALLLVITLGA